MPFKGRSRLMLMTVVIGFLLINSGYLPICKSFQFSLEICSCLHIFDVSWMLATDSKKKHEAVFLLWKLNLLPIFCFEFASNFFVLNIYYLLNIIALLIYNLHNIEFAHLKYTNQWVLVYSWMAITIIVIHFRTFHHPKRNSIHISNNFLYPLPSPRQPLRYLLSLYICLF